MILLQYVSKNEYLADNGNWWNMCIPNRFTVVKTKIWQPISSMLPMVLIWDEVAPDSGMTQRKD